MTKLGRKPNAVPTIDWKCYVPIPIAAKVDMLLLDPFTGKPRLGARSELVTQLLIRWLNERQAKGGDNNGLQETSPQEITD